MAAQVAEDYTKADLSPRERRMADFAVKVTRAPNACSPDDLQNLRNEGLSDKDILSLAQIIAYYNMSTRLFESLSTIE
ncbi:MAG: peroxidase [Candidatus Tectomicrobia bacterium]